MKNLIWLTYDLSVGGDYDGLYAWLDNKNAKECCESNACFYFEYQENLINELKEDVQKNIKLNNRDRIYVVYNKEEQNITGKFIAGGRRSAPWVGYGNAATPDDDELELQWQK